MFLSKRVKNRLNKIYIQACYLLSDEKVKLREYGNLKLVKDNYPKLVVSLDLYAPKNIEGIQHIYLRDFLLSENFSFL